MFHVSCVMLFSKLFRSSFLFISVHVQQAEFMLLCLVPVVIISQLLQTFTDSAYVSLLFSVLVLLPIPIMFMLLYRDMNNAMNSETDGDAQSMDLHRDKVSSNSAVTAATPSTPMSLENDIEMITSEIAEDSKMGGTVSADDNDKSGMDRLGVAEIAQVDRGSMTMSANYMNHVIDIMTAKTAGGDDEGGIE